MEATRVTPNTVPIRATLSIAPRMGKERLTFLAPAKGILNVIRIHHIQNQLDWSNSSARLWHLATRRGAAYEGFFVIREVLQVRIDSASLRDSRHICAVGRCAFAVFNLHAWIACPSRSNLLAC
jgi:hypothetical protein